MQTDAERGRLECVKRVKIAGDEKEHVELKGLIGNIIAFRSLLTFPQMCLDLVKQDLCDLIDELSVDDNPHCTNQRLGKHF
jgi:hypothetical protein